MQARNCNYLFKTKKYYKMSLKGILSIATYPGLYRHVAQAKNGLIVESIVDGKRNIAFATSRISALEDISIYTNDGDVKLSEVYKNLYKALDGKPTPFAPKKASDQELTELFTKALPNWDTDRVYISDIKRAYAWYNILVEKGFVDGKDEEETEAKAEPEAAEAEPEAKPKAKKAKAEAKEEPVEGEIKTRKRTRKKAEPKEDDAK